MKKIAVLAACIMLSAPVSAIAQSALDSALVLIPARPMEDIQADVTEATNRLFVAQARVPFIEGAEKQAQLQVDPWSKQIDLIKAKIDAAQSEKNKSAEVALEAEKSVLERQKNLAENNYDLRKAETDLAKANSEWVASQVKSLKFEAELAKKRAERAELLKGGTSAVGLAATDQSIRDFEKRALEAQKDEADKSGNRADKEKNIVSKRIKMLETQDKLMTGK